MTLIQSWVASANAPDHPFPLNNLPYGVFSTTGARRLGVAIGDHILDVAMIAGDLPLGQDVLCDPRGWNSVMEQPREVWHALRAALTDVLRSGAPERHDALVPQADATMHMPFQVTEFTDFYASRDHTQNVGTMLRGADNALPPNWLHIPIGYNGRASSVVASGTQVTRPWGQIKGPEDTAPRWAPSQKFDIELELGAIVGTPSNGPIGVAQADANIFGYVLLNDWSARDIQAWEYQPLGPFQSKATATTIGQWIVTTEALAGFRCETPARTEPLLPHLRDCGPMLFDIDLTVALNGHTIAKTNANTLYYSAAQQLAHHTTSGCPMRTGDLLGSGTISGPDPDNRGCLMELTWGAKDPLSLPDGTMRGYLQDGDQVSLTGKAVGNGFSIGFGHCDGTIAPAGPDPIGDSCRTQ